MIILNFDRRYYRWAELLLNSLELHERGHRVRCDTVGLDEDQVERLSSAHPSLVCRNIPAPAAGLDTPSAMANRKAFVLRDAIDCHDDEPWFCLLDADMLVRRPLEDLWRLLDDAPTALIFTNGMWDGRFYARLVTVSSVVLVRRDGRELVDRWIHWFGHDGSVDGIAPGGWFWDQVTLFLAWTDFNGPIARISIAQFANDQLDPDAAIWAANVPDKDAYFRRFQAEHKRQRNAIDEPETRP
jgi:hypothetical protein